MNDAQTFAETAPAKTENFDVLIVGAGISGIGGAYHLTKQCPGTSFVVLESQDKLRRHVAHPSLSGHPLRQRPAHLRLSLQAMDQARRSRPRPRSWATWARSSTRTTSAGTSAIGTRSLRQAGPATDNLWTIVAVPDRHRRGGAFHRELPVDVPGLLPALRGLHAAVGRHGELQGPDRASADLARGPGLRGQERRGDRLGRHRGDADPGDRSRVRPRHDAAALADVFPRRPQCDPAGRGVAGTGHRRGMDPRDRPPQDPARAGRVHPPHLRANPRS